MIRRNGRKSVDDGDIIKVESVDCEEEEEEEEVKKDEESPLLDEMFFVVSVVDGWIIDWLFNDDVFTRRTVDDEEAAGLNEVNRGMFMLPLLSVDCTNCPLHCEGDDLPILSFIKDNSQSCCCLICLPTK